MHNVTSLYLRMLHEYLMYDAQMHRNELSLGLDKTKNVSQKYFIATEAIKVKLEYLNVQCVAAIAWKSIQL